ncbi:MAG: NADH-quinone oxidoreductase subunit N [Bacteroidia bacterium]|nr:NADH-quinone oxidoreductase subunit N [Bacteroidia bacterium]
MNELLLMKSELVVTAIIFILLFIKINDITSNETVLKIINALLVLNVGAGFCCMDVTGELFSGMFKTNVLIAFEKNMLNIGTLLISLLSYEWLKNHRHLPEFFVLLLSSLLGMFFMISSGNFLIFYLGLELSTIPIAALCNFDLEKKQSSEAAMKMIMSSAFSSGILLFGISMMYGTTGTLSFAELPQYLDGSPLQVFSFILLFTGFAFKLSVVPFHLWTADVYEGSPVAVTSFLSVISKGSIIFIFLTTLYNAFAPMAEVWYNLIFLLSVLTMVIGNLFALRQQNMKRFLAFSSIAQVGFILIGISGGGQNGISSSVYFVLIYIFSNLGAFGAVQLISSFSGKETIDSYKGLYQTNPLLSWVLTISLFSLAGIPPTAGFFGKFFLLSSGAEKGNYILITIAALNMIVSLYYYLRVVRAIFMDKNEQPIASIKGSIYEKAGLLICVIGIIAVGLYSHFYEYIYSLSIF